MAFGEYAWWILGEATALVELGATRAGDVGFGSLTETGIQAAYLVSGAFPQAEEVFVQPLPRPEGWD